MLLMFYKKEIGSFKAIKQMGFTIKSSEDKGVSTSQLWQIS